MVLLVHGLGGCHRSGYMQRLGGLLLPHGLRVVRMDLRGAGAGAALARRSYHGGCSEDVRTALGELHRWSPNSPVVLVGLSLGGNIALKLAGEAADNPISNLQRVAAVAPPIDLTHCSTLLERRRNRFYENFFVRHLVRQVRRQERFFRDLRPMRFPRQLSLRRFDDLYTAPRSGFASAADYYHRASALPLIPKIQVPSFILTARDDPFIAAESFEQLVSRPEMQVHIAERGGHLGFLGWDGAGGIRWAERRVVDWILGG
jgi:predicted alpha/beta-fold hydrolase